MNYLIDLRINNEVDHLIHHVPLNNLHNVPLFIHETNRRIRRRKKKSNLFNINHLFFKHFSRDHCRSKIHSCENDNRVKQQRSTKSESGLSSTMVTFTTPSSEVQAMVEKSPDEIEKKILGMASNHY